MIPCRETTSVNELRVPPAFIIRIYETLDNDLGIDENFTKYFKGSC